jgi:hypothetical protein
MKTFYNIQCHNSQRDTNHITLRKNIDNIDEANAKFDELFQSGWNHVEMYSMTVTVGLKEGIQMGERVLVRHSNSLYSVGA